MLRTDPGQAQPLAIAIDRARLAGDRRHDRRRRHDPGDLPVRDRTRRRSPRRVPLDAGRSRRGDEERIVLAYSGGLDTSVAIPWLAEKFSAEIIAVTLDLGQGRELVEIRERALALGAVRAHVIDVREEFARDYILPALQAGALYEDRYPLATALGRPLIAKQARRDRADGRRDGDRARLHAARTTTRCASTPRRARSTRRSRSSRRRDLGHDARRGDRIRAARATFRCRLAQPARTAPTRTCGAARSSAACSRIRGRSRRTRSTR